MAMDFPVAMPATDAETTTTASDISSNSYGAAAFVGRRESVSIGGEQATAELARSLPELIAHLRLLHVQMEKSAKVYDAISSGQLKTHQEVVNSSMSNSSNQRQQQGQSSMVGAGRQSIFTPFADSLDFDRASIVSPPDAYADVPINRHSAPLELGELSGGAQLMSRQTSQQMLQQQRQNWPAQPISAARKPAMMRSVDYTVMWVSGECGISLRNFSTNKIGAQIAVLQQAEGVTTGIANCRLGDQLISVNDDRVEVSTFKEIVQKLKTTRRPITLGFRTNPNVATSPVAASSSGLSRSASSSARFNNGRKTTVNSNRAFFPADEEPRSSAPGGYASAPVFNNSSRGSSGGSRTTEEATVRFSDERPTDTSVRSSTSTLSDEVEVWCKEQEEMHSDIIVLLTETVMRCEKLQQENMDQLQNWMQVAPSMYSATTSASSASATLSKKDSTFALLSNTGSDSEE